MIFEIFCFYNMFVPQIIHALTEWKNAWVKEPILSEQTLSCEVLWAFGLQSIVGSEVKIAREIIIP